MSAVSLPSKPHYPILDGLRGVAALLVVAFHLCEAHAMQLGDRYHLDQVINHGYLAVDFFFLLSGFVIGYAYDDRWGSMSFKNFFTRRLVRLHPLVIWGTLVGALLFYFQASDVVWLGVDLNAVPVWKVILTMLVGFTLIPLTPSMDIRGWAEMHPLNGPCWSLFFEYVANILYALFVRKLSNTVLAVLVFLCGAALIHLTLTNPSGDVTGGWSFNVAQLHVGFVRMLYPFFAGLLLFRVAKLRSINNAFLWCSMGIIVLLSLPRFGGADHFWMNGLYEALCIILFFPLIVYLGASGNAMSPVTAKVSKFFGDLSYPIYITHYPIIYVYTAWAVNHKKTLSDSYLEMSVAFIAIIALGYLSLKLYDEPVRKWLGKKVL
jgi:peptidoglycan/LPS O-acetylase OafA/YrhL